MVSSIEKLTIEEFFALPEGDRPCELIDGKAVPKMSPKFFHAAVQGALNDPNQCSVPEQRTHLS